MGAEQPDGRHQVGTRGGELSSGHALPPVYSGAKVVPWGTGAARCPVCPPRSGTWGVTPAIVAGFWLVPNPVGHFREGELARDRLPWDREQLLPADCGVPTSCQQGLLRGLVTFRLFYKPVVISHRRSLDSASPFTLNWKYSLPFSRLQNCSFWGRASGQMSACEQVQQVSHMAPRQGAEALVCYHYSFRKAFSGISLFCFIGTFVGFS